MNEQIESLSFYLEFLKSIGVKRSDITAQHDVETYIAGKVEELKASPFFEPLLKNKWGREVNPLEVGEIDVRACLDDALDRTYGASLFDLYAKKESRGDANALKNLKDDVGSFWERLNSYGKRAYGLAVGRVQSGKTRNYIGLMLKAIDSDFNVIVVLTSKNSLLAVQTHRRVMKWVAGGDTGLNVPNLTMLSEEVKDANDRPVGVRWKNVPYQKGRIHVGVIIKNESGHLDNVREWMAHVKGTGQIGTVRLLLIDDESDSATPNTNNAGASEIECDADINRKIDFLYTPSEESEEKENEKRRRVADWLKELCERTNPGSANQIEMADFDFMQSKMASAVAPRAFLRSCILEDEKFKRIAGLDRNVTLNDGTEACLCELVAKAFDNKATRRQVLSARALRDCLNYLFGVKQSRSRINQSICQIAGTESVQQPVFDYGRLVYAGYTATPFANLLNENPCTDPLCPDCIKPLSVSSQYFGLERIFGGAAGACSMNIVRTIPGDEKIGWITPLQKRDDDGETDVSGFICQDLVREHNFSDEGKPADMRSIEWTSLKRAVQWAFCTAAARRAKRLADGGTDEDRSPENANVRWTTMLFNISHLSNQESGVHRVQQDLLKAYLGDQLTPENRDRFVASCLATWREETASEHGFTEEAFRMVCSDYGNPQAYPDEETIRANIRWFIEKDGKYQIVQMNSSARAVVQENYDRPEAIAGDVLWFVCGGNAVSRGLTLDGLTVSYFDRIKGSSAVDTITQMGRWFGYRKGYELLPRIWMTDETIKEMKEICRTEESLHHELQALYDSEDRSSIRTGGRDVASIEYFGRRLSGRDANGMEIEGSASKGVFSTVANRPKVAFAITERFVHDLGDFEPVPEGCSRKFHQRHRMFWRDVKKDVIADYIQKLQEEYFKGVSSYESEALLREIANSLCKWNVVIGNPDVREKPRKVEDEGGTFAGYVRRNNPCRIVGREVSLGTGQWTSLAFLARVPDAVVDEAHRTLPSMNDGDIRHVESAYRLLSQKSEQELWSLAQPTLLIDFVNGPDARVYVQVAFYWYGHDEKSYYKAKISPLPPPGDISAVKLWLDEVGYAALGPIARRLGLEEDNERKKELRKQLDMVCGESHSPLKKCGAEDADELKKAVLQDKVYYSSAWLRNNRVPVEEMSDLEQIGLSLYWQIQQNGWLWERNRNYPDRGQLKGANRDQIIAVDWDGNNPRDKGPEYFRHYSQLAAQLYSREDLEDWWNRLPDDDFRKRQRDAALAVIRAKNEAEAYEQRVAKMPENAKRQIRSLHRMFAIGHFRERKDSGLGGALKELSRRGAQPLYPFGRFVVVGLLRPLVEQMEGDKLCLDKLLLDVDCDDDVRREVLGRMTMCGEYRESKKHYEVCKAFLVKYGDGIVGESDGDEGGLRLSDLMPEVLERLVVEDRQIKAQGGEVLRHAREVCAQLEQTLNQFNLNR